ncbi:MAG TPA: type I restriction enzyme HsdR N-terminal domain-containing protein [Rhizomicrobium sp.]|nr:type I restriction enzyme HsdR N-terminal domain-containing protein [Rhizomicrobium sp.]
MLKLGGYAVTIRIPSKVSSRILQQLKKYQSVIGDARKRDINESDTAVLVIDVLADILGYRKVVEITAEHAVRGTFADIAVRVGTAVRFLVEVKAVNVELKESHVTQVVNYAANLPADWVVLTNGVRWQAYKISFAKPIDRVLVLDIDLCTANLKSAEVMEFFGGLSREVFTPDSMSEMFRAKQAMSRYSIAALLISEPVIAVVRRELKKLADGLNPDMNDIRCIVQEQVIKRELMEADEAKLAQKAVRKLARQQKPQKPSPVEANSAITASVGQA